MFLLTDIILFEIKVCQEEIEIILNYLVDALSLKNTTEIIQIWCLFVDLVP